MDDAQLYLVATLRRLVYQSKSMSDMVKVTEPLQLAPDWLDEHHAMLIRTWHDVESAVLGFADMLRRMPARQTSVVEFTTTTEAPEERPEDTAPLRGDELAVVTNGRH